MKLKSLVKQSHEVEVGSIIEIEDVSRKITALEIMEFEPGDIVTMPYVILKDTTTNQQFYAVYDVNELCIDFIEQFGILLSVKVKEHV